MLIHHAFEIQQFFNGVNCRDATEPNEGTQSNDNQPYQNEYHNEGPDFVLPFDLNWPKIDELIPDVWEDMIWFYSIFLF